MKFFDKKVKAMQSTKDDEHERFFANQLYNRLKRKYSGSKFFCYDMIIKDLGRLTDPRTKPRQRLHALASLKFWEKLHVWCSALTVPFVIAIMLIVVTVMFKVFG